MIKKNITYQLATHYLSKIALRLESFFLTIEQACHETHPVIHHYALKNIIEIIRLIEKPELKSRFLKELIRIEHSIKKSPRTLTEALNEHLSYQIHYLSHASGRFGEAIQIEPFLQAIRLSSSGKNHDCEIHFPQLLLWLEGDSQSRQNDLSKWLKQLTPLQDTTFFYLSLLRQSTTYKTIELSNGFYQCQLPNKLSCHLILLRMNKECGFVPKMQLGHHGLSLRLCEAKSMQEVREPHQAAELAICQI